MKPKCILFAGPGGCSKSQVAYFLSWNLGLPIFSTNAIRIEVNEDKMHFDPNDPDFFARRKERWTKLLSRQKDFIYDASVDRSWHDVKMGLDLNDYDYFLISFNVSKEKVIALGHTKNYQDVEELTETWYSAHQKFIKESTLPIGLTITDDNFSNRLELSLGAVTKFIGENR